MNVHAPGDVPGPQEHAHVRLAIVDGRALVATSLHALMAQRSDDGIVVVYVGDSVIDAVAARPDVVLIDIEASGRQRSLDTVLAPLADLPVVLFGSGRDPEAVRRAMRSGARAYISSASTAEALCEAVRVAAADGTFITPDLAAILGAADGAPVLSEREREALVLYVSGLKLSAVASQLGVSPHTAREYLDRVREKYARLGRTVRTRTELYAAALQDGLLPDR